MLYPKYVIEAVYSDCVVRHSELQSTQSYNGIELKMNNMTTPINSIRYIDKMGNLGDYQSFFNTYEEAYKTLDRFYDHIIASNNFGIRRISIIEVFDRIEPPLLVIRKLKLQKIKKRLKK